MTFTGKDARVAVAPHNFGNS